MGDKKSWSPGLGYTAPVTPWAPSRLSLRRDALSAPCSACSRSWSADHRPGHFVPRWALGSLWPIPRAERGFSRGRPPPRLAPGAVSNDGENRARNRPRTRKEPTWPHLRHVPAPWTQAWGSGVGRTRACRGPPPPGVGKWLRRRRRELALPSVGKSRDPSPRPASERPVDMGTSPLPAAGPGRSPARIAAACPAAGATARHSHPEPRLSVTDRPRPTPSIGADAVT